MPAAADAAPMARAPAHTGQQRAMAGAAQVRERSGAEGRPGARDGLVLVRPGFRRRAKLGTRSHFSFVLFGHPS